MALSPKEKARKQGHGCHKGSAGCSFKGCFISNLCVFFWRVICLIIFWRCTSGICFFNEVVVLNVFVHGTVQIIYQSQ